jgi:hypothetical protein
MNKNCTTTKFYQLKITQISKFMTSKLDKSSFMSKIFIGAKFYELKIPQWLILWLKFSQMSNFMASRLHKFNSMTSKLHKFQIFIFQKPKY